VSIIGRAWLGVVLVLVLIAAADAKVKITKRQQLKAFCITACQHPAGFEPDVRFYQTPQPQTSTQPDWKLVKACMNGFFDDWGNSTVCGRMCSVPANPIRGCVPEIIQTKDCGPIAACRAIGEVDPYGCGEGCFVGTMTCAAGTDRFYSVTVGPGLPFIGDFVPGGDCQGEAPRQNGLLLPDEHPHIICAHCCPQGSDF
jgi:hypothetical protein